MKANVLMSAGSSLQPPPSSSPAGASAIHLRERLKDPHSPRRMFQEIDCFFWGGGLWVETAESSIPEGCD